ncbi:MAG TPA: ergothioneine biosynthesis protein EgtB [Actinocrinis sp.]|nr:ergothioneine biosynthesis protein EgtB [Actinocrinis sp.]HZP52913.1 ergothioneine biosynthesis protein EgtB [Actinocrinis sp.]
MTDKITSPRDETAPDAGTSAPPSGPGHLPAAAPDTFREQAAAALLTARDRTLALTGCVDDNDLKAQHSPLMSPLVWDLAHVGNQEEIWLVREAGGRPALRADLDSMYDAFQHPRADRPALPLLSPQQARAYIADVREHALDVLDRTPLEHTGGRGDTLLGDAFVFGMIAQHEQQHDETMLATHQLRRGPAVLAASDPPPAAVDPADLPSEVLIPGGPFVMGTSTEPWALDNERPAHQVHVPAFFLDTFPVTNAAYRQFIDDGGYRDPRWWSDDGWEHREQAGLEAPLFWERDGGDWLRRRFGVLEPVPPQEPVMHVCWYEADAYARWAGRRLPTEAEWEKAARHDPAGDRSRRYPWGDDDPQPRHANLGQRHLRPAPIGAYPDGASPQGVHQLIGDVWEWTASDFLPHPGFTAYPYKEYSEVFFGPAYKVLRGGAFGVDPVACRGTFRNWDYPIRRQIFSGFRTARDVEGVR